jgi:hypothetical protein
MGKTNPNQNKNIVIGIIVLIVFCLCLGILFLAWMGASAVDTPDEYVKQYGGSRDVYQRLLTLDDCQQLQAEFDRASTDNYRYEPGTKGAKWTTGYMTAANERMKAIGCYK